MHKFLSKWIFLTFLFATLLSLPNKIDSLLSYTRQRNSRTMASLFSRRWKTIRQWSVIPSSVTSDNDSIHLDNNDSKGEFIKNKEGKNKILFMFQTAKAKENAGHWREAANLFREILSLDHTDAHTHLALARLEAKQERSLWKTISHRNCEVNDNNNRSQARDAFEIGSQQCPESVHIWQAWARYEAESCQDIVLARELFNKALEVEDSNPYVCHSFGLMEKRRGNVKEAKRLWEQGLEKQPTAALVCSLGELFIEEKKLKEARNLYRNYLKQVKGERQITEIYLASAWLEERYFRNSRRAKEIMELALVESPSNGRVQVALARLEGRCNRRQNKSGKTAARQRLYKALKGNERREWEGETDGRLFNVLAKVEIKSRKFKEAKQILNRGMERFPHDTSLLNAAGQLEILLGNVTAARTFYNSSIALQPSAPALVALAMMELRNPEEKEGSSNYNSAKAYFERALLLDPRHGPAYNAYGNMEFQQGNLTLARDIYRKGVQVECSDPASVYHGLAKIELSMGNIDLAREILLMGLKRVEAQDRMMDSSRHERAVFLVHTLGILELNSNRVVEASRVFNEGMVNYDRCSQLLMGAALCAIKLGSMEKARSLFDGATKADKNHAQAWQAWGVMESRADNMTAAKILFESGIRNCNRHGALWNAYGVLEGRLGNLDKARALFKRGMLMCPNHIPLYQGLAGIEMREGNLVKAKKFIGEALTQDKTQGSSWLVAAQIEKLQGNTALVDLILRRGIQYAPAEATLYRELGESFVQKGKINEARKILEKGLEFNPLHAPLYHSLAELEARIFNLEGLAKLNERASKIFNTNALISSQFSAEAWSSKLRMGTPQKCPKEVDALAGKDDLHTSNDDNSENFPTSNNNNNVNPNEITMLPQSLYNDNINVNIDETPSTDNNGDSLLANIEMENELVQEMFQEDTFSSPSIDDESSEKQ
mmetsp:Transcript_32213/g.36635  ORF Transcript_32213/g.36635 Transcript_32213/m.36635 type:complete len:947 (+) Transcript_32213:240-3080(+)